MFGLAVGLRSLIRDLTEAVALDCPCASQIAWHAQ